MPVGIEAYTSTGILQFDSNLPQISLVQKGQISVDSPISFSSLGSLRLDIPNSVTDPIIAIRSYNAFCPLYVIPYSGGRTFWYIINQSSGVVDYYLFDRVSNLGSIGNIGTECYDANGRLVFSSNRPPPLLQAFLPANGSTTLTSGRQYAAVLSAFSGYRIQVPNNDHDTGYNGISDGINGIAGGVDRYSFIQTSKAYGVAIRSGVAFVEEVEFMSGRAEAAPDYNTGWPGALILDVTAFGGGFVSGDGSNPTAPPSPIPEIGIRITPSDQTLSGDSGSAVFAITSADFLVNGEVINPSSYQWSIQSQNLGSWSFVGSSTDKIVQLQVSNTIAFEPSTASVAVTIGYNGKSYSFSTNFTYTRTT